MEVAAISNLLAAKQCVNCLRLSFSLHGNEIEFEDRKFFLGLFSGPRSNDNWDTIKFCLALQTCCNVYRIAENRIVKAQVRSNVANNASPRVYTYADAEWQEWLAGAGFLFALKIERLKALRTAVAVKS